MRCEMNNLKGKVVVICGASRGIGLEVAKAFATEGAKVVAVARTAKENSKKIVDYISGDEKATYVQADLTTQSGVDFLYDTLKEKFKKIDVLVNNIGTTKSSTFENLTEEQVTADFKNNFLATMLCCQKLKPLISDGGHIINTSSIRGIDYAGRSPILAYSAFKSALNSLTKNLAILFAPKIYVNAIAPGFIETEALLSQGQEAVEKFVSNVPIKRLIKPNELAEVYTFLATTNIFTGSIIVADGGYTILEK